MLGSHYCTHGTQSVVKAWQESILGDCVFICIFPQCWVIVKKSERQPKYWKKKRREFQSNLDVFILFYFFFKTGFLWSPGSPETSSVDQVARTQLSTSLSLSSAGINGMQLHFLALWSYVQWILFCCTWIWIQFFTDGRQTLFRATSPAPFAVRFQLTCSDWLWACSVSQDSLHLNFFCPGFLSSWDYRPATPGL